MKETIDLICEKIGVVIDWTADNVWPQVMDVLSRYRTYEIIKCTIAMILFIAIIVTYIIFVKKIVTDRRIVIQNYEEYMQLPNNERPSFKRYCSQYWDASYEPDITGVGFGILVVGGLAAIVSLLFLTIGALPNLLEWVFVPETQYLDILQSLAK